MEAKVKRALDDFYRNYTNSVHNIMYALVLKSQTPPFTEHKLGWKPTKMGCGVQSHIKVEGDSMCKISYNGTFMISPKAFGKGKIYKLLKHKEPIYLNPGHVFKIGSLEFLA